LRSSTLDSLHTGVSPDSIGWAYTYSGPFREAQICEQLLWGFSSSNPDRSQSRAEQAQSIWWPSTVPLRGISVATRVPFSLSFPDLKTFSGKSTFLRAVFGNTEACKNGRHRSVNMDVKA